MRPLAACLMTAALALAATGCGSGEDPPAPAATPPSASASSAERSGRTLRVPADFATIQRAVDASRPGDLVLVGRGVYRESVKVEAAHARIVIRGVDRNEVVLDGGDELSDGIAVQADGVAVENLTVRRFAVNGLVFSPRSGYSGSTNGELLKGWRGSYVTAYDNGLYGVYAFGSQGGRFDHVYASGHPDSGIYVGRCKPCRALVRDSTAEHNHVGYEGTNAGGDVTVVDNVLSRNRVGVQINSLLKEQSAPQVGSVVAGNLIEDNQDDEAPRGSQGFGAGVVLAGARENVVRRNRITGHRRVGVLVEDSPDFTADANRIEDNALSGNRLDLALTVAGRSSGTCFTGNEPESTSPVRLESRTRCGASVAVSRGRLPSLRVPGQVDYREVPAPPDQPSMPDAATAPARPAVGLPERVDLSRVETPAVTR